MGFQKFMALGNVTNEPETRTVGENEVAKFSIAVNGYKDTVEFFDLEWWKPNGAMAFIAKGTQVFVDGELQTQRWEKDGQKRSKIVVKVRSLQLTGSKPRQETAEFASDFA